ncbi:MAG: hypothetical protein ACP6IU_00440 [Candidatus Asgardarchaeia archaeon]
MTFGIDDVEHELQHARFLLSQGKWAEGIQLLKKVADHLFDIGEYIKAFDVYFEYAAAISEQKGMAGFEYSLLEVAERYKQNKLWEEAGRLYIVTANYLFEQQIYEEAAWLYEQAAEAYERAGDFHRVVSSCLVRAAECYDKLGGGLRAEWTLLKGLIKGANINPTATENRGFTLARRGDYLGAAAMFLSLARLYEESLNHLVEILKQTEIGLLSVTIKTIILHYTAEAYFAAAVMFYKGGDKEQLIKALNKAKDEFEKSAYLVKAMLDSKLISRGAVNRCAFDALMTAIILLWMGEIEEIGVFYSTFKNVLGKASQQSIIQESIYYRILSEITGRAPLTKIIKKLQTINLGKLENIRDYLMEFLISKMKT